MGGETVKKPVGFSWRWNDSANGEKKRVLILYDESQTALVGKVWARTGGVPVDWAGNTPWLDRLLPCGPFAMDAPEQEELLRHVFGGYEQAAVLLLYGKRPATERGLDGYLRTVKSLARGAKVVWVSRGRGMGGVKRLAAAAGIEYLDCAAEDEDACATRLAGLAAAAVAASGKPSATASWVREEAEWTHVSFDRSNLPAVLLVGDSICNGYSDRVRKRLSGRYAVDFLHTSEGTACPQYERMLDYMTDWRSYRLVHLNVGIHLHGAGLDEYEQNLTRILRRLRERSGAKVVFATTTPAHRPDEPSMLDVETTRLYMLYNDRATGVCARLGLEVDDLFAVSMAEDLAKVDRHHYTPVGYDRLGDAAVNAVIKALG